jgi:hypothetical protein
MAIVRLKALPRAQRIKGVSVPESLLLAKRSLYEAWFNTLVLSPFYQEAIRTNVFISADVKRTCDLFGNLNGISFDGWWMGGGYKIFEEAKPFNKASLRKVRNPFGKNVPVMSVDIPLDVSPQLLREQFEDLLKQHHPNYKKFDRWKTSTAKAKLRATRLTFDSIDLCLQVYKKYLDMQKKDKVLLYKIGEELRLNPRLNVLPTDFKAMAAAKKLKMASTVSEYLEKAKNLVAHATECNFPVITDHPWYEKKRRPPRRLG